MNADAKRVSESFFLQAKNPKLWVKWLLSKAITKLSYLLIEKNGGV